MFDTLLIITLFLVASLLVCLLTLRLIISIKHLCLFFHSLPILTDTLKFRPPSPPFIKFNKDFQPPVHFDLPLFIRHLRVHQKFRKKSGRDLNKVQDLRVERVEKYEKNNKRGTIILFGTREYETS